MPRNGTAKVWAEYEPATLIDGETKGTIVRVFLAATPALWSAVDAGHKVVGMQPGETLEEALTRDAAEKQQPAPARAPRATRKVAEVEDKPGELAS